MDVIVVTVVLDLWMASSQVAQFSLCARTKNQNENTFLAKFVCNSITTLWMQPVDYYSTAAP